MPAPVPAAAVPRLRLGVSACLLGRKVRFDGQHKHDPFLTESLGRWVDWVEVCPEVELGLGIPRPTLRLVGDAAAPRMEITSTGEDLTRSMQRYAAARVRGLGDLDGYVLKRDSPSCGLERVKVYVPGEVRPQRSGRGLFAAELARAFPLMPLEEEGRLHDPVLRENFVERIFAYRRWRDLLASRPRTRDLVAFHTRHKLAISAHDARAYRALGRLVANAGRTPLRELLDAYGAELMQALARPATRGRHADVLYHLLGHLKAQLDAADREELVAVIEDYRQGRVPLVVPITLLRHHFRRHPSEWVLGQTYLDPYPSELMLRNHV